MRAIGAVLLLALWALILPAGAAHAAWHEAQSSNFVIYADEDADDLHRLAERLERFHAAMEAVTGTDTEPPSPSNRLTIYVVETSAIMRRLSGSSMIAGFYSPRAGRPVAFVPAARSGTRNDFNLNVLLHEYAHHFLITNSSFALPTWYGEGSAEFFAAARFNEDGGLALGLPAAYRYAELFAARDVPVEHLFDPPRNADGGQRRYDNFYGKSWLLFHMLVFDPEWRGKMPLYLAGLTRGESGRQAAEGALGNFAELNRALDSYMRRSRMLSMVFRPEQLPTGPITVRAMNAGEAEMMPLRMVSVRGVTREQALELVPAMRGVAARHPGEAAVLDWLAEGEYDAGNDTLAIAAADAALALDPARVNAYVQKGYALFRLADAVQRDEAPARIAAFRAAAEPFLALNARENDHPLTLQYYYHSFTMSGRPPTAGARAGLARAVELAPFDGGLRITLAAMHLGDDAFAEARGALLPVAYAVHGGTMADAARTVIERIDAGGLEAGAGVTLLALLDVRDGAAADPAGKAPPAPDDPEVTGEEAGEGEGEGEEPEPGPEPAPETGGD